MPPPSRASEQGQSASVQPQQPSPVHASPGRDSTVSVHGNDPVSTLVAASFPPWSDIVIRPDMTMAEIKLVAQGVGRPKVNAAAEALIMKWFRVIDGLISERISLPQILDLLMSKGPDTVAFKKEFNNDPKKFGRLIRAARATAK